MSARAECKPRLYGEHGTIVGIIVIVNPQRSYKKLIAYFERLEIFFPIIFPILVFANGEVYFIWYIFRFQPLAEIRNRLARIFVFGNIYVDKALCTVFFQRFNNSCRRGEPEAKTMRDMAALLTCRWSRSRPRRGLYRKAPKPRKRAYTIPALLQAELFFRPA